MKSHPFTLAVRDELARQLSNGLSELREIKLQQTDLRDPLCLCFSASKSNRAWIVLGSDKEKPTWLRAFAGWTTEGLPYSKLPFIWLGERPFPPSGSFDALDLKQYDDQPTPFDGLSGMHIKIDEPSSALQESVAKEYLASSAFQSWLDGVMPFEARKKVPPTREAVAIESGKAERIFMRQWSHLLDRKPEAVAELLPYLQKPIHDLATVVLTHTRPALHSLLSKTD